MLVEDGEVVELPHSVEAERAVLGGVMANSKAFADVSAIITDPGVFFDPKHEAIYRAILELVAESKPADPSSVTNRLREQGVLQKWSDPTICYDLEEHADYTWHSAGHNAAIVNDMAVRRRVLLAGRSIVQNAIEGELSPDELVEFARKKIDSSSTSIMLDPGDIAPAVDQVLAEAVAGDTPMQRTGWLRLDNLIGGLRPGALYIVGARPGVGKTVIGLNLATRFATTGRVGFVSLEMSRSELTKRMIASEGSVRLQGLLDGQLSQQDWEAIERVKPRLQGLKLSVIDTAESLSQVLSFARTLHRKGDLNLLVVDYLQLMRAGKRVESRQQEVSEFSRSLKLLAKELNIPVLALSQLNRESANRAGGEPKISDLRESGSLEQDADVVVLLHRVKEKNREMKMIVAKNRQGRQGEFSLLFEGEFSRVVDPPYSPLGDVFGQS